MDIPPPEQIFMAKHVVVGRVELIEGAAAGRVLRIPRPGSEFVLRRKIEGLPGESPAPAHAGEPGFGAMAGRTVTAALHHRFQAVFQARWKRPSQSQTGGIEAEPVRACRRAAAGEAAG